MIDSIIRFKVINKQCISRSKLDKRASIVSYVNASHVSEKTATKHAPRTFTEIGRLCRVALKQEPGTNEKIWYSYWKFVLRISICDIPDEIFKLSYRTPLAFSYGGLSCLNVLNRISVKRSILRELIKICSYWKSEILYHLNF